MNPTHMSLDYHSIVVIHGTRTKITLILCHADVIQSITPDP